MGMTIPQSKPLLINLNVNNKAYDLPTTASAVGIDLNTGKQLYYNTSSLGWAEQETIAASYGVFSHDLTSSNLLLTGNPGRIVNTVGPLLISSSLGINTSGSIIFSGSRSDLGTEETSVLVNGDIFVSGGIGLGDYLQLKPVQALRIPTNTTASYIYTSGSTNDLYFTQYNGPYTNTTRLRWLESILSSGVLNGGLLSTVNGTTTFSITSGSGLIVNYNATISTDPYPTTEKVDWPAFISQSLTYINSAQITYIGLNPATKTIIQRTTPFSNGDFEQYFVLGRILHQSGSVTNGAATTPHVSYGVGTSHDQFIRSFGPLKISGHVLAASGSTLSLVKTGGDSYVEGRNYTVNPSDPDYVQSTSDYTVTVSKIFYEYVNGSGNPVIDSGIANAGYTVIDPARYNNNGTLATVPGGSYTIQRVYWFPNAITRAFYVYYGSATYNSLDVAQAAIATEAFTEGQNSLDAAILVAFLIVKSNATDLSNTSQAKFIQAGAFRGIATVGGSGGGGSTTPGGLDTYVQFNDGGSTFGGVSTLTFNKTTNTLSTTNLQVSGIVGASGSVNLGDASSDIVTVTGQLTASQGLSSSNSISAAGNLLIQGSSQFTGSAYFAGNVFLGDAASDATTTTSQLTASNGIAVTGGTLSSSGNISTAGNLYVQGTSFHTGAAYFGNVVSASSGFQAGASSTLKALVISGAVNAAQTISASGNISTAGSLFVQGTSQYTGSAYFTGSVGQATINISDTTQPTLYLSGTNTRGGAGYFDFLKTSNNYSTGTNRDKYFRLSSTGDFQIINSAYSATLLEVSDAGNLKIQAGSSYFGPVKESFAAKSGATGTVTHDCVTSSIFYHTSPGNNWTANFTNLNLSASYATSVTMVISQGATAYLPTAVQIEGVAQTLNWQGNTTPSGTPSRNNIVTFSILNNGGTYIVMGQIVSF